MQHDLLKAVGPLLEVLACLGDPLRPNLALRIRQFEQPADFDGTVGFRADLDVVVGRGRGLRRGMVRGRMGWC